MRPVVLTLVSQVSDTDSITTTQTLGAPGNLTINGDATSAGVATFTTATYVVITSSGNDSGVTWTVTGTGQDGAALIEKLVGSNGGAAVTTNRFLTVTQIAGSAAAAANVIAGSAATANSEPCPMDFHANPFNVGLGFKDTGSTTGFKVQYSMDDPWGAAYANADAYNALATWFDHQFMTALKASTSGNIAFAVRAIRLQSDQAGTDTGTLTINQSGL